MYASVFCEPWTWAAKDAEVVQLFGVRLSTIKRYLKQRREEGHMRPKTIPGRPAKKRAQVEADVLSQLQAHDDASASATQCHVGANSR
jgi:transposase